MFTPPSGIPRCCRSQRDDSRPEEMFHMWGYEEASEQTCWGGFTPGGCSRGPTVWLLHQLLSQQRRGHSDFLPSRKGGVCVIDSLKAKKSCPNVKCWARPDVWGPGPRPPSAGTQTHQEHIDFPRQPWLSNGVVGPRTLVKSR